MQRLAQGDGICLGVVAGIVAQQQRVILRGIAHELLTLHLDGLSLASQLQHKIIELGRDGREHLEEVDRLGDVCERDVVVKLE